MFVIFSFTSPLKLLFKIPTGQLWLVAKKESLNLLRLGQLVLEPGRSAREKPVHLSPITVTNALPGTVQLSTTQFLDESYTAEKYIFDIKRPFHPPEQMYARVGRNGKELDGCGI